MTATPTLIFRGSGKEVRSVGVQEEAELDAAWASVWPASNGPIPAPQAVDYRKAPSLTLDLRWEFPGVKGSLTVDKREIRELQKLQPLDAAALKQLKEESERARERLAADDAARLSDLEKRRKADEDLVRRSEEEDKAKAAAGDVEQLKKDADKIARGLELLARFPPPEWSPEKLSDIVRLKTLRKQPLTPQEKEFQDGLPLWIAARTYKEARGGSPASPGAAPPAPPPEEVKPTEEKKP